MDGGHLAGLGRLSFGAGAMTLYGGIEFGGTKVVVGVGDAEGMIVESRRIATRAPDATLDEVASFFEDQRAAGRPVAGLGVGAFGPIVLDPASDRFGCLLATPKPGWSNYDLVGGLRARLGLPVRLVTDVAAAGIAEARLGALRDAACGVYLTVGTGIGAATLVDGRPLPSMLHAEMGHLPLRRLPGDDFASICAHHPDCAEGLASGPAIEARFGASLSALAGDAAAAALVADYLGQLCASIVLAVSPHRIVFGGGVAKAPGLSAKVQARTLAALAGYADLGVGEPGFLVPPALGDDAGLVGSLLLAAA